MIDLLKRIESGEVDIESSETLIYDIPKELMDKYGRMFYGINSNSLYETERKIKSTKKWAKILIPTIIGTVVNLNALHSSVDGLYMYRDKFKANEKRVREVYERGAVSSAILTEVLRTQSFLREFGDLGVIPEQPIRYLMLHNSVSYLKPRAVNESLEHQGKVVLTKGRVSEYIPTENNKVNPFVIEEDDGGKLYCYVTNPVKSDVVLSTLYKQHNEDSKSVMKEATLDELNSFLDSARISEQEVIVGGIAREGRLESDVFSFTGKSGTRRFAYILRSYK